MLNKLSNQIPLNTNESAFKGPIYETISNYMTKIKMLNKLSNQISNLAYKIRCNLYLMALSFFFFL